MRKDQLSGSVEEVQEMETSRVVYDDADNNQHATVDASNLAESLTSIQVTPGHNTSTVNSDVLSTSTGDEHHHRQVLQQTTTTTARSIDGHATNDHNDSGKSKLFLFNSQLISLIV